MKLFRVLSLIALALLSPKWVVAADYYVAPGGNDAGPGTKEQPWATLKKASPSVQPGDTVHIREGNYGLGEKSWEVRRAGTADQPITFKAEGAVRISCSTTIPPAGWKLYKGAIYQTEVNSPFMCVFRNGLPLARPTQTYPIDSVEDLHPNSYYKSGTTLYAWLDDGSDPAKSDMQIAASHVITLHGCHYTVFDGLTLELGFTGFSGQKESNHVTIRNCTIRSMSSQGIIGVGENSVIDKNVFQRIGATKFQHGIYSSIPGLIIRNNIFEEISGAAIHQYGDAKAGGEKWEISGNVFRKPRPYTTRTGTRNYVDVLFWARNGNQVFGNEFYGDGKRAGIDPQTSNNHIYNNKFFQCRSTIGSSKGSGNEIHDNVEQQ